VSNSRETGQNHSYDCGSNKTVASFLCGRAASCEQHRRINLLLALVHSHRNNTFTVQHAAKLCYTLQMQNSLCNTRPRCATRRKAVQHAGLGQGVQHTPKLCNTRHSAKVCNTPQTCATRGTRPRCATRRKAVSHAANAKFTVHTPQRCATRRKAVQHTALGQGLQHAAKLCKVRNTAKLCNTLQSCGKEIPLRPCAHPLFCHSATLLL
jgi:hypothetical protein